MSLTTKTLQKPLLASALLLAGSAVTAGIAQTSHRHAVVSPAQPATDAAADPFFAQPYVDVDEWRDAPVRHRYIHGGFKGTETRFSFYFPDRAHYQGRFFQHITPVPDNENNAQKVSTGEENKIGFSIASGAYFVETNGGGKSVAGFGSKGDATIGAYRANAAAARYSRVVAQSIYSGKRPFGYAFGGSGGAYRTVGSFENTKGVWDGVVPYVLGSSMAIPNMFSIRMHAMRILKDKFPQIVDAVEPGGSGDPYAGLNAEQASALHEVTRMGFPTPSWFGYRTMGVHGFAALYPGIVMADPGYFTDFWTKPGYLGHDHPESFTGARIQYISTIAAPITALEAARQHLDTAIVNGQKNGGVDNAFAALQGEEGKQIVAYRLTGTPPPVDFLGGDLVIQSGPAKGRSATLSRILGDVVVLGVPGPLGAAPTLAPGDTVRVDNSNFLAAQTYHRHQVPGPEYKIWDQFRGADGSPLYPQRPMILGPLFTKATAGSLPEGKFEGKMILVESLWDREAMPWQGDWYRQKVQAHLGAQADSHFRLWYTDHALHGDDMKQDDATRTVSYLGVLQQALRDLSAWVEKGIAPPETTGYRIDDSQVVVPATAAERKGIQPVVTLTANGGERADVAVGQPVRFTGTITVPPGAGSVIAAEWDFDGAGTFPDRSPVRTGQRIVTVNISHSFVRPGTYFPALRGISQRQGDARTPFARIQNLGRVRVVVK
ncbi:MAG TPA: hypothetical protein VF463_14700 [Sphingobium sp.]